MLHFHACKDDLKSSNKELKSKELFTLLVKGLGTEQLRYIIFIKSFSLFFVSRNCLIVLACKCLTNELIQKKLFALN